ncbi:hypothetical protein EJF18_20433 [Clavispora lusitaniae]|uniref:Uncharacterized protein n=2 Tax=Clavispora lusitaniae TaxID=36911 RepID=A0AA91PXM6_CLALS|nr:hypothetical protein E0198_001667 [Clavispora lusitaniae]KAF7583514.1 hypothetical protein FOB63_001732 [Clavispora lusitaniae]OVF07390.1 hypothetical protein A9F13_13g00913 [Clavispora lusitaniae]QFZ26528.1 hypothetical protein EJF14_20433 [Clavispora lusitaniae]QFZ32196.1 hypothetical protein EJF16_20433 [Clavispora lusitaniae]
MFQLASRSVRVAARSYSTAAGEPKKIGAFRGGLTGFLLGVTTTGVASYYYLLDEYVKTNNVILVDLLSLNETVVSLEKHVKALEDKTK